MNVTPQQDWREVLRPAQLAGIASRRGIRRTPIGTLQVSDGGLSTPPATVPTCAEIGA
jgi:hypothetical protein